MNYNLYVFLEKVNDKKAKANFLLETSDTVLLHGSKVYLTNEPYDKHLVLLQALASFLTKTVKFFEYKQGVDELTSSDSINFVISDARLVTWLNDEKCPVIYRDAYIELVENVIFYVSAPLFVIGVKDSNMKLRVKSLLEQVKEKHENIMDVFGDLEDSELD